MLNSLYLFIARLFFNTPQNKPIMNLDKLYSNLPEQVATQIPDVISVCNLHTPLRLAHFLAQCAHESGNWKFTSENLNYSAAALRSVFRKYFPDETSAAQYARKPESIANKVYANRMSNGDESSGDGWRFRGRGYIQLTGRKNYNLFNMTVPEDLLTNPELVAEKYPLLSAGWFWDSNKLNDIADLGSSNEEVTLVTKRVNGGTHGLEDRISKFKTYFELLNS